MIHIIPLNDREPHEPSQRCWCCPESEVVNGVVIVVHNAFDNRLVYEEHYGCMLDGKPWIVVTQ
jgi:hypothetical protein